MILIRSHEHYSLHAKIPSTIIHNLKSFWEALLPELKESLISQSRNNIVNLP